MAQRVLSARRLRALAFVVFGLVAWSGGAAASSASVDFGAISHKGLKDLGPASTGLKLSLELGLIADQQGIANAVKAASNPSSSSYGDYLSLSTLQQKYGATSSRRNAVVGAFKTYGVTATVDVTHLRVSATISIGNAQKMFGTKWHLYATGEQQPGRGAAGRTRRSSGRVSPGTSTPSRAWGSYVTEHVSAQRVGVARGAGSCGLGRRAGRRPAPARSSPGCATTTYPSAVASTAGPVPEPDPHRLRDRVAAGRRPEGPGHPRRDPRRGADAGRRRDGVPQLLRLPGDGAEDPRRLGHHADPRELAGRDDALDGRAEARAARPVGEAARPERSAGRARAARRAAAGDDERHAAAERDLDLLRRLRGERQAVHAPRGRCSTASWPRRRRSGSRRSSRRATAARRRARTACRPPSSTASTSRSRRPGRRRRPGCSPSAARTSRSRRQRDRVLRACGTTRSTRRPYKQTAGGRGRRQHASRTARGGSRRPRRRRPTGWSPTSPRSPTRAPAT